MNVVTNQSPCGTVLLPADGALPASGAALEALARHGRCLRSAAMFDGARTLAGRLRRGLRPLLQGLYRQQIRRRSIAELSRLDARLLADIGLRREDIPLVVDGWAKRSGTETTVAAAAGGLRQPAATQLRACTAGAVNDDDCRPEAA